MGERGQRKHENMGYERGKGEDYEEHSPQSIEVKDRIIPINYNTSVTTQDGYDHEEYRLYWDIVVDKKHRFRCWSEEEAEALRNDIKQKLITIGIEIK
jgi:hypothetical protein